MLIKFFCSLHMTSYDSYDFFPMYFKSFSTQLLVFIFLHLWAIYIIIIAENHHFNILLSHYRWSVFMNVYFYSYQGK